MPTDQDIRNQLEQLKLHRENVLLYRHQALAHGGLAFAPVATQRGLADAYAGVERCKAMLRGWEILVEDAPEDQPEEEGSAPQKVSPAKLEQAAQLYRAWVLRRYGEIQILGMHEPVPLGEIFTDVVLLDRASTWLRHSLDELRQRASLGDPLPPGVVPRPGLELVAQTRRLYLLGRPGSGKSTFLRSLACTSAAGEDTLPILVDLKEWARSGSAFPDFLATQIAHSGARHAHALLGQTLANSQALLLFDGLDEVAQEQGVRQRTIQAVRDLADRHPGCRIIVSCRTAADEHVLEGFTYAELADFSAAQVRAFAAKWFRNDPYKRERFLEELDRPAHAGLRDLARTPLLLTLLCLGFEATVRFPERRVDLYEAALDLLLQRWDASRSVERDGLYRAMPLARKRQLLARIALETFERGEVFVRRADLERRVAAFLARLPGAPSEEQIDARAVLAAIEAQHGLLVARSHDALAFSHLTFQEYFAARAIVENPSEAVLAKLIGNAGDPRWHEVLLMVASLLDEGPAGRFFELFVRATQQMLLQDRVAHECVLLANTLAVEHGAKLCFSERLWRIFVWIALDGKALLYSIQRSSDAMSKKISDTHNKLQEIAINQSTDTAQKFGNDIDNKITDLPFKDTISLVIFGFSFLFDPARKLANELKKSRLLAEKHDTKQINDLKTKLVHIRAESRDYDTFTISSIDNLIDQADQLINLLNQKAWLQTIMSAVYTIPYSGLRWLNLLWHLSLHRKSDHSAGPSVVWRSMLAGIPERPPEVQTLRTELKTYAVPKKNASTMVWQQWFLSIYRVLVAHQHMGLEWAAGQAQGSALGPYLAATALLHECLEQATVANREQILEQLLRVPEE